MYACHRSRFGLLALGAALLLGGCRDDGPVTPAGVDAWQEAALGAPAQLGSSLLAIDFAGGHGAILGAGLFGVKADASKAVVDREIFRYDAGHWAIDTPAALPSDVVWFDLALDDAGGLVTVGAAPSGGGCRLYDDRGSPVQTLERVGLGMTTVDGDGGFFTAGGYAAGGRLWSSQALGEWPSDTSPLSGTDDGGLNDMAVRGDTAVACGFDDGADTLQVLLRRTTATGWQKLDVGAGTFGQTFRAVALADDGTIYVGGIDGAGGTDPRAFLSRRSPAGDWSAIALPAPGLIGAVNDILLADGGVVYLACGGEVPSGLATVVRVAGGQAVLDVTPFHGDLYQLGAAPDGRLFAVGLRRSAVNASTFALLLSRAP